MRILSCLALLVPILALLAADHPATAAEPAATAPAASAAPGAPNGRR